MSDSRDTETNGARLSPELHESLSRRFEEARIELRGLPQQLGRWRLVRFLGSGGMGAVALGVCVDTGEQAAIKFARADSDTASAALRNEAEALAGLAHPNLPRLIDQGTEDDIPFLALEYLEGETLSDRLDHGATFEQIADYTAQIADALHALHERGLVHRDVKPDNVIVQSGGRAVLIDFGLTSHEDEHVDQLAGTVLYMAPEQVLRGPVAATPSTDIYGLAMTLLVALNGGHPWMASRSVRQAIDRITFDGPPLGIVRDRAGREAEAVLRQALAKDPRERFRSAAEFARDLRRIRDGLAPRHTRVGVGTKLRCAVRRNPRSSSALAIALFGAAIWITVREVAYEREISGTLDRASIWDRENKSYQAFRLLMSNRFRFGNDPRFQDLLRTTRQNSAERELENLLASVAFSVPTADGRDYRSELDAAVEQAALANRSALVIRAALVAFQAGELERALKVLERFGSTTRGDRRAEDLRHIIRCSKAQQAGVKFDASLPDRRGTPTPSGKCLRALAILGTLDASTALNEDERTRALEDTLALARQVIEEQDPEEEDFVEHRCALALQGLVHLRTREFDQAVTVFSDLVRGADLTSRLGSEIRLIQAQVAAATPGQEAQLLSPVRNAVRRLHAQHADIVRFLTERVAGVVSYESSDELDDHLSKSASGLLWTMALDFAPLSYGVDSVAEKPLAWPLISNTAAHLLQSGRAEELEHFFLSLSDVYGPTTPLGNDIGTIAHYQFWCWFYRCCRRFGERQDKHADQAADKCLSHARQEGAAPQDAATTTAKKLVRLIQRAAGETNESLPAELTQELDGILGGYPEFRNHPDLETTLTRLREDSPK